MFRVKGFRVYRVQGEGSGLRQLPSFHGFLKLSGSLGGRMASQAALEAALAVQVCSQVGGIGRVLYKGLQSTGLY